MNTYYKTHNGMYYLLLNDQQIALEQLPVLEDKGLFDPYKWLGVKPFFVKFKSGVSQFFSNLF